MGKNVPLPLYSIVDMCRREGLSCTQFFVSGYISFVQDSLCSGRRSCADIPKASNKESCALKEEENVVSLLRVNHVIATTQNYADSNEKF